MKYNEYKASEGKVLLTLNSFQVADVICSKYEQNVIELDKETAMQCAALYEEQVKKQEEEEYLKSLQEEETVEEEVVEEQPLLLKSVLRTATLQTAAVTIDPLEKIRNTYLEELSSKGYDVTDYVEPIIHE